MASTAKITDIPSPCISVCKMNTQTGLCEGCWRTLDEIASWGTASDSMKQAIWQKIYLRKQNDLSAFDLE